MHNMPSSFSTNALLKKLPKLSAKPRANTRLRQLNLHVLDSDNISRLTNCVTELELRPNVAVKLEDLANTEKREALFTEKIRLLSR